MRRYAMINIVIVQIVTWNETCAVQLYWEAINVSVFRSLDKIRKATKCRRLREVLKLKTNIMTIKILTAPSRQFEADHFSNLVVPCRRTLLTFQVSNLLFTIVSFLATQDHTFAQDSTGSKSDIDLCIDWNLATLYHGSIKESYRIRRVIEWWLTGKFVQFI